MCGLVGYFGQSDLKVKSIVRHLLEIDVVRGPHSTGIGTINKERHFRIAKDAVLPQILFKDKAFAKAMGKDFEVFIGHNRYATRGKINKVNAHPFKYDNVMGAHNGTIRGLDLLLDYHKFSSDSNNLFYMIEQEGIETTWKNLDGAAALTYWDNRDDTINLIRNVQRPLCFALSKDKKHLLWASEAWMIESVKKKFFVQFEEDEKGHYIFSGEPNVLFSFFKKEDNCIEFRSRKIPAFTYQRLKTKEWWLKEYGTLWEKVSVKTLPPAERRDYAAVLIDEKRWKYTKPAIIPANKSILPFIRSADTKPKSDLVLVDKNNRMLTEGEFLKKYDVCAVCTDWLEFEEDVVFIDYDNAVCGTCNKHLNESNIRLGLQ